MKLTKGKLRYLHGNGKAQLFFSLKESFSCSDFTIVPHYQEESEQSFIFSLKIEPHKEVILEELCIELPFRFSPEDRIYLNGFQSWTQSREFSPQELLPRLNRIVWPWLKGYGDYSFYKYKAKKGCFHSFTYTYHKTKEKFFTLLGSLSERSGYTIFEYDTTQDMIYIKKECEGVTLQQNYHAFHLFFCQGKDVFSPYFQKLCVPKISHKPCTGWTSWYNYYTNIDSREILDNLSAFVKYNIPIDIFQIDDGYQQAVGDWLDINAKFPSNMKEIAIEIQKAGYKAGLWLAPFICERKSKIWKEHEAWILRYPSGKPVAVGYNPLWSGNFYALDFYHPEVRSYLQKVFHTVLHIWGFDMVKLDFLYAVAFVPRKGKSRGQIMTEALEFLRDIVGDKIILGCGVPLGPAFGKVDFCRIGSDVALKWEDTLLKMCHYRERVSTFNSLTSTIHRNHLNGQAFLNDPDVFILRQENQKLTSEQKYTLFILNLLFGSLVFTSDNLHLYTSKEWDLFLSMFPLKAKKIHEVLCLEPGYYRISFQIQERNYFLFSNLSGSPKEMYLPKGLYFDNRTYKFWHGSTSIPILPYSSCCFLEVRTDGFAIAGSTGHIFPGCEVAEWRVHEEEIFLYLEEKSQKKGQLYFKIPTHLSECKVNGQIFKSQTLMVNKLSDTALSNKAFFSLSPCNQRKSQESFGINILLISEERLSLS